MFVLKFRPKVSRSGAPTSPAHSRITCAGWPRLVTTNLIGRDNKDRHHPIRLDQAGPQLATITSTSNAATQESSETLPCKNVLLVFYNWDPLYILMNTFGINISFSLFMCVKCSYFQYLSTCAKPRNILPPIPSPHVWFPCEPTVSHP